MYPICFKPDLRFLATKESAGFLKLEITNKKVLVVVALCLAFLACCYAAYHAGQRYMANKMQAQIQAQAQAQIQAQAQQAQGTEHLFMDGAPLYDRTATGRVEIKQRELPLNKYSGDLHDDEITMSIDEIYVDGKAVCFPGPVRTSLVLFGKQHNTKEVIVTDDKDTPELVIICERETNLNLKGWVVNTSQVVRKNVLNTYPVVTEQVLLAYDMDSLQNPVPPFVQGV